MSKNTHTTAPHILVIDDNQSIHEDFRKILGTAAAGSSKLDDFEASFFGETETEEEQTAYEIDSAFQGQDGLNLVRRALQENRPYPLAFVDMRMPPGWDGLETISRIWDEYPDLQVVICTAYSDYTPEEMKRKLGKSEQLVILKKPFDCGEVLKLAKTLMEKWKRARDGREQSGSV